MQYHSIFLWRRRVDVDSLDRRFLVYFCNDVFPDFYFSKTFTLRGKKIIWRHFEGRDEVGLLRLSSVFLRWREAIDRLRRPTVARPATCIQGLAVPVRHRGSSRLSDMFEWCLCKFRGLKLKYLVLSTFVWPVLLAVLLYFLLHINRTTVSGMDICVQEKKEWVSLTKWKIKCCKFSN